MAIWILETTEDKSPEVLVDRNGFSLTQARQEEILEQVSSLPASQTSVVEDYTKMIKENGTKKGLLVLSQI